MVRVLFLLLLLLLLLSFFAWGYLVFRAQFVEKIRLSSSKGFGTLVKKQLATDVWVYFWTLNFYSICLFYSTCLFYSICLNEWIRKKTSKIYMSIFMVVPQLWLLQLCSKFSNQSVSPPTLYFFKTIFNV